MRGLLAIVAFLALLASASAQTDFSLQMSPFNKGAVNPGGNTAASLTLSPLNGFTGSVSLSCQVTPTPTTGTAPACVISPQTVTPPTGASVTVTATNSPPGLYTITVTGTAPSATPQTASQTVSVLSVTPSFTITLGTAVTPNSVPAGSQGTGTIDINPINGYTGSVTLSCSSVAPVVVSPPVCTFNPSTVSVGGPSSTPVTLTISTIGPTTITRNIRARGWYALWLPLPMLPLLVATVGGKRLRGWGMVVLLMVVALVLLMPACGTSTTPATVNSSNVITPNNTYTFTITGVDQNGESASNTSSGSTSSVTLGVTTATTD